MSEVVCVGLATRDTILAVPRHPAADELVMASDVAIAGGGPAATAAVTLARLGVATAFVGAVGDDETGAFIRESLESQGVDVSELAVVPGRRSPESAIYVGPGTRAIAAFRGDMGTPRLSPRAEQLCRDAAWVHVDQTGYGSVPARRPALDRRRQSRSRASTWPGARCTGRRRRRSSATSAPPRPPSRAGAETRRRHPRGARLHRVHARRRGHRGSGSPARRPREHTRRRRRVSRRAAGRARAGPGARRRARLREQSRRAVMPRARRALRHSDSGGGRRMKEVVARGRLLRDLRPQLRRLGRRRRRRPAGIRSRLPYLRELGVDALWLTPFYPSPGADHGYDVADYVDVDPQFGTLADFDALVADAHDLGLRLTVDIVPNHTSIEHPWFERDRDPSTPTARATSSGPARRAEQLALELRRLGVDVRRARAAGGTSTCSRPSSLTSTGTTRPCSGSSSRSSASGSTAASTASGSTSRTRSTRTASLRDEDEPFPVTAFAEWRTCGRPARAARRSTARWRAARRLVSGRADARRRGRVLRPGALADTSARTSCSSRSTSHFLLEEWDAERIRAAIDRTCRRSARSARRPRGCSRTTT